MATSPDKGEQGCTRSPGGLSSPSATGTPAFQGRESRPAASLPPRGGSGSLVDMDWTALSGEHGLTERLAVGWVRMDGRHDLINRQLGAHRQRVLGNQVGGVRPEDGRAQN